MNDKFDELAKGLAQSVARRGALKQFGVGLAAVVLASLGLAHKAQADIAPGKTSITWSQIGAKAGAEYKGDGLVVSSTPDGAQLRCVFQRLEGEATREGVWLTSTVTNTVNDRFRLVAASVGRLVKANASNPLAPFIPMNFMGAPGFGPRQSSGAFEVSAACPKRQGTAAVQDAIALARTGRVQVGDKLVRFLRPGVIEEYTVSMDGLRQDFIIGRRPVGAGPLRVELEVAGAKVEPLADGAQLVLENSGRKIAYSRLRVTDAVGKELTARMEVVESNSESQRDSVAQPRVGSLRATLGQADPQVTTLKGLRRAAHRRHHEQNEATPLGLKNVSRSVPRVARQTRNLG